MKHATLFALAIVTLSVAPASALQLPYRLPPTTLAELAQSCSSAERDCTRIGGTPTGCAKAKADCMKSGTFVGPSTGKRFGPLTKK